MTLCFEDISHCFPGLKTSNWYSSLTIPFLSHNTSSSEGCSSNYQRDPADLQVHHQLQFVWTQWYCFGQGDTLRGIGTNLEWTLHSNSLLFNACEGSWVYTLNPSYTGQERKSHDWWHQMYYVRTMDLWKLRFHQARSFHFLPLYLLLRLKNTGSWSNPHHPKTWTWKLKKTY